MELSELVKALEEEFGVSAAAGVVMAAEVLGGLGELALTGSIAATIADFTIGWPGILLQIAGTYFIYKKVRG